MDLLPIQNYLQNFSINNFFYGFGAVVVGSWYLWLPAILVFAIWKAWVYYIRLYFITHLEWVLLEIKLPREVYKGPMAMELVLNALYQARSGNFIEKYWDGFVTPWFSLEIVSIGGRIRFFIYAQKPFKKAIESEIYAQYPDVEVSEAADYTRDVFDNGLLEGMDMGGTEFKLGAVDAYPIKTYIDYGLDKAEVEEEYKTDPMNSLLEFFGSLKNGEQAWFQILIRATKTEWKKAAKKIVDEILKREKEKEADFGSLSLSPGERIILEAVERTVSKYGFDTLIRTVYIAPKDKFNKGARGAIVGAMRQYDSLNLNGFKTVNATALDNYYVNFAGTRVSRKKRIILDAYRQRAAFYIPHNRRTFVLNTEELATIFHFPGKVAETPTFPRIEAKRGEPPTGLPV